MSTEVKKIVKKLIDIKEKIELIKDTCCYSTLIFEELELNNIIETLNKVIMFLEKE